MANTILKSWDSSYSVGVSQLDQEHQKLLDMFFQLHQALTLGKSKAIIVQLVSQLREYTLTHFKNEENYLEQINHPTLDEQKQEHAAFIHKVDEFEIQLDKGNTFVSMQVLQFLNDWIAIHILDKDMKFANK